MPPKKQADKGGKGGKSGGDAKGYYYSLAFYTQIQ